MPEIDEKQLKAQIKNTEFDCLYFIYGDEPYLKKFYANKIAEKTVDPAFADFNLHRFEGKGIDLDVLAEAVEAYPMMSEKSCVVIHDLPADSMGGTESEKLWSILNDVPETCVLVIWMDDTEIIPARNAKWKNFINKLSGVGNIIALNKKSRNELAKIVCSGASRRGCEMSPDLAVYFVSLVGDDMTNLLGETEKLCAYVGSGAVTRSDVDEVAVKTVEAVVFDLAKAIMNDNAGQAFRILDTLFSQKAEPVMVLGALISPFVDMYRAKICRLAGGSAEDAAKFFDYRNKVFRLKNASRDSSDMSVAQIKKCLDELDKTDTLLKSSGLDAKLVMEQCITRLILAKSS